MKFLEAKKGFTLIELLVVIAIIGILSAIVLVSLNTSRAKARDTERLAELRQLQTAVEFYANDNGGAFPSTGGAWWGNCSGFGSHSTTGATGYVPNLTPTYIAVLPLDPKPSAGACYLYRSDGTDYLMMAYQTVETYTTATNPRKRPAAPTEPDFALYTPGAVTW